MFHTHHYGPVVVSADAQNDPHDPVVNVVIRDAEKAETFFGRHSSLGYIAITPAQARTLAQDLIAAADAAEIAAEEVE